MSSNKGKASRENVFDYYVPPNSAENLPQPTSSATIDMGRPMSDTLPPFPGFKNPTNPALNSSHKALMKTRHGGSRTPGASSPGSSLVLFPRPPTSKYT
jgi:hypothetical protein